MLGVINPLQDAGKIKQQKEVREVEEEGVTELVVSCSIDRYPQLPEVKYYCVMYHSKLMLVKLTG